MIARVTLEIALRREFDYLVPDELRALVDVGSRVKVPFGHRQVLGVVTRMVEESTHSNLKSIVKVIGGKSLVTPKVLELARWIAGYYCCPLEIALKSVLPETVRREKDGWKKRLFARALTQAGELPKLTRKQAYVWNILEEWRELPLQELVKLAETTADTIRRLEDKGLLMISSETMDRDPYANEQILPTTPLELSAEQKVALDRILAVLDPGSTGLETTAAQDCRLAAGNTVESVSGCQPEKEGSGEANRVKNHLECSHAGSTGVPLANSFEEALAASPFFQSDGETDRYSRWLPHWRQANKLYFVTFRLADSVAQDALRKWTEEKRIWDEQHPKPRSQKDLIEYGIRFTERMEQFLDAGHGSCRLSDPKAAAILRENFHHFDGDRYQLGEYVIMPNHIHILVRPSEEWPLEKIVHSWKSYTANELNKLQGQAGTVWMSEYFDHLVRSEAQLGRFESYIRRNPEKAWLKPGDYIQSCGSFKSQDCRLAAGNTAESVSGCQPEKEGSDEASRSASLPPHASNSTSSRTFLLHGVTGSGKTEVYLQAIARCLEMGKGAIVLVPEISLTPQTVERFKARFGSGPQQTLVAVLHSHLSAGEKHDEWHKIRQGRAKIVIGARSAIFAPVDPLGLIIVDEEHEHSYKQAEAPRYHARDLAVVRGQREHAVVVLGSATPSMESFYNAVKKKYELLELPHRADDARMPVVRVVDMRHEMRRQKGSAIFSLQLREAILQRLERKEQTILFLNRRGYATSMQCPACGFVAECPNCSVALTYHRRDQKLKCHICGYDSPAPRKCPEEKCGSAEIRYAGLGTEKVEDALREGFPHAKVARMDSDTLKKKEDYRRILTEFRIGKIDILIGTQMIAKGLHFPNVTLVGIIHADLSLHLPDFRAGERTFQLLTQVAGRAGRGDIEGEVFVQSFTPFHPAIQYSRRHDFVGFYEQEIEFRDQLCYPPASRIAMVTIKGRNEDKVSFLADHFRNLIEPLIKELGDLVIAGPAPAPLARAETFYRFQLMLRTRQMSALSRHLAEVMKKEKLPKDITVTIDIDPVNLS